MNGSSSLPVTEEVKYEGDTICPHRDATLRAQLNNVKDMLEASSSSGEEQGKVAKKSLFETLRECMPSKSPPVSFLDNRYPKTTRASLISNGYAPYAIRTHQDVWTAIDKTGPHTNHVLIVRDINSEWSEALCDRYPGSIDRRFLLEHMIAVDLQLFPASLYQGTHSSQKLPNEGMEGPDSFETLLSPTLADLQLMHSLVLLETKTEPTSDVKSKRLAVDATLRASDMRLLDLSLSFTDRVQQTSKDLPRLRDPSLSFAEVEQTLDDLADAHEQAQVLMYRQSKELMHEHLLATATRLNSQTKKAHGVHVNLWCESQTGYRGVVSSYASTHEEFRKSGIFWAKSNAYVSHCRLANNLRE